MIADVLGEPEGEKDSAPEADIPIVITRNTNPDGDC